MKNRDRVASTRIKEIISNLPYTNVAIFLLLLGMCSFIYTAQRGLESIEQIKLHNDAGRVALQNSILLAETMSLLKDVESGQRGFIITGDDAFLAPYKEAREQFGETYRQLTTMLESDARDTRYSHEHLDHLVSTRIQQAAYLIDERRSKGDVILQNASLFVEGKLIMDKIRLEIGQLQEDQMAFSDRSNQLAREVQQRSFNLNYWIAIGATVLMFVSAFFLIREKRIRDRAQEKLRSANATLEEKINERTAQLQTALQRIQTFAIEQEESIESERRRLAREVHDQLGQVFTSLKLVMLGVKDAPPEVVKEKCNEFTELLDDGITVSRRISSELRPALLDDFGLAAAVEHYAQVFVKRGGPQMTVVIEQDSALSSLQANQLFRILQEAATNILRHANADRILIEGGFDEQDRYRFSIIDNGIGPQPIRSDASGVRNMRERAALAGGSFQFGPAARKGTMIVVTLPVNDAQEEYYEDDGETA